MKRLFLIFSIVLATVSLSNAQELGVRFGIIGELGLECRFRSVPIALGADRRPYFQIVDNTHFDAEGVGLNLRWVFGGR